MVLFAARTRFSFLLLLLLLTAVATLSRPVARPVDADNGELIVVSIGDSSAAGQGAPDFPTLSPPLPALWNGWSSSDPFYSTPGACHRSHKSGPAQGYFNGIKAQFPNSTFVSVACSGAEIDNGLINPQKDGAATVAPNGQLAQVQKWMADNRPGKRIDALFINVGVNDIGFADIVTNCVFPFDSCVNDVDLHRRTNEHLAALDAKYDLLASNIDLLLKPIKVYIVEYPDPTLRTATQRCDGQPVGDAIAGITRADAEWAATNALTPLNQKVHAAAQRHANKGWHVVDGVSAAFVGRGWCALLPRINTFGASWATQGDVMGVMHPNANGYQATGERIKTTFFATQNVLSPTFVRTTGITSSSVTLGWNDHSQAETRYEVEITNSAGVVAVQTLPANAATFTHGSLTPGQMFKYRVRACNSGCAPWSNQVTVTVPQPPSPIPAAPSNLKDTITFSGEQEIHTLSWKLNSSNQTRVEVKYRKVGTSSFSTWTMPTATTNQYRLPATFGWGYSWEFQVVACNSNGCSAPSNLIQVDL